jgi:hypothetical protein
MAEFGQPGERTTYIPPISQETLAEMIGTTRSRVSFFMNRFRTLGFISYNGRIQVHKSLLNVVLLDQFPGHNAQKPILKTLLEPIIPAVAELMKPVVPIVEVILKPVLPVVATILKPVVPLVAVLLRPVVPIVAAIKRKIAVEEPPA